MGACMHVQGIKPSTNPDWQKMKHVRDACVAAGIDIPAEVDEYFDYKEPHALGVVVNLEEQLGVDRMREEYLDGFEVDLKKLPKDITVIRIFISY